MVNVCVAFVPHMQAQSKEHQGLVVATGSKQGITCPPGTGVAYNMSKALVKVYAEQLAHELRQDAQSRIDVKLLVPGWVWTALTGAEQAGKSKPDGAWTPEQTVDYFQQKAAQGSFYVVCPDNETTEAHDKARMEWSAMDVVHDSRRSRAGRRATRPTSVSHVLNGDRVRTGLTGFAFVSCDAEEFMKSKGL